MKIPVQRFSRDLYFVFKHNNIYGKARNGKRYTSMIFFFYFLEKYATLNRLVLIYYA